MKNVALLGCSHSHMSVCEKTWIKQLADRYSNLNIDSFAMCGHGHLYYDMVLKWIMYESDKTYDWIIIQFTGEDRWHIPTHPIEYDPNNVMRRQKHSDNFTEVTFNSDRACLIGHRFHPTDAEDTKFSWVHRGKHEGPKFNRHTINHTGSWNEARIYSKLLKKQIAHMAQTMPISYFTMWPIKGAVDNIGLKTTFRDYFISLYGEENLIQNLLDETSHFNTRANELIVDKLISLPLFNQHLS